MNEQRAAEFEHLLDDMCRVQTQLVAVAERKQSAMIALDTAAMDECTAQEFSLAERLREVSTRKEQWAAALAAEGDARPSSLAGAIELAPAAWRGRLAERLERLTGLIEQVKRLNWVMLTTGRHCVKHFRSMIEILTRGTDGPTVYTPRGNAKPSGGCLIDDVA